MKEQGKEQD